MEMVEMEDEDIDAYLDGGDPRCLRVGTSVLQTLAWLQGRSLYFPVIKRQHCPC